jgi:AraC-like DNA-binding protein
LKTLVRAAALTNYAEVARHLGLDPREMLRKHGLRPKLLADPDQRVPMEAVVALLEDSALQSDCLTFGLRMAESRPLSNLGAVSLLITHQSTVRAALQTVIDFRHLMNEAVAVYLEDAGELAIVREEVLVGPPGGARQVNELVLCVLCRLCSALLGAGWRPRGVNFVHGPPPEDTVHRRVFGCTPAFGCEFNGMICEAADLDRPNSTADPAMARYARRFLGTLPPANRHPAVFEVRKAIYLMLPTGRAKIEHVALGLGLNVRTLQRQLDDSGVTFSDLLDEVRSDLVLRYLDNHELPLSQVAELLGYGMPSSFTRWFSARFGMAPVAWRRTHAAAPRAARRR